MKKVSLLLMVSFLIVVMTDAYAEDIYLTPGESYTIDAFNVICQESQLTPSQTKECQYWGGFNNERCVYEKTIYAIKGGKCVEECQYWSERNSRCLYSKKCQFDQQREIFIKTECAEYDKRNNKCRKTKKIVLN